MAAVHDSSPTGAGAARTGSSTEVEAPAAATCGTMARRLLMLAGHVALLWPVLWHTLHMGCRRARARAGPKVASASSPWTPPSSALAPVSARPPPAAAAMPGCGCGPSGTSARFLDAGALAQPTPGAVTEACIRAGGGADASSGWAGSSTAAGAAGGRLEAARAGACCPAVAASARWAGGPVGAQPSTPSVFAASGAVPTGSRARATSGRGAGAGSGAGQTAPGATGCLAGHVALLWPVLWHTLHTGCRRARLRSGPGPGAATRPSSVSCLPVASVAAAVGAVAVVGVVATPDATGKAAGGYGSDAGARINGAGEPSSVEVSGTSGLGAIAGGALPCSSPASVGATWRETARHPCSPSGAAAVARASPAFPVAVDAAVGTPSGTAASCGLGFTALAAPWGTARFNGAASTAGWAGRPHPPSEAAASAAGAGAGAASGAAGAFGLGLIALAAPWNPAPAPAQAVPTAASAAAMTGMLTAWAARGLDGLGFGARVAGGSSPQSRRSAISLAASCRSRCRYAQSFENCETHTEAHRHTHVRTRAHLYPPPPHTHTLPRDHNVRPRNGAPRQTSGDRTATFILVNSTHALRPTPPAWQVNLQPEQPCLVRNARASAMPSNMPEIRRVSCGPCKKACAVNMHTHTQSCAWTGAYCRHDS
jgi:hypothetical protein